MKKWPSEPTLGELEEWLSEIENTQPAAGATSSTDTQPAAGALVPVELGVVSALHPDAVHYIASVKKAAPTTWRQVLHGHACKGKRAGGPVIHGHLVDHIRVENLAGAASGAPTILASLKLPHSFTIGDCRASQDAVAEAYSRNEGIEQVCKEVMIELILRDSLHYPVSQVCLSQTNWTIPIGDLLLYAATATGLRGQTNIAPATALLSAPARQTRAATMYEPPVAGGEEQRDAEITEFIRALLHNERGYAVFCHLAKIQWHGQRTNPWMVLARLVKPLGMANWLQDHRDEFDMVMDGRKLIGVRWRQPAAPVAQPVRANIPAAPAAWPQGMQATDNQGQPAAPAAQPGHINIPTWIYAHGARPHSTQETQETGTQGHAVAPGATREQGDQRQPAAPAASGYTHFPTAAAAEADRAHAGQEPNNQRHTAAPAAGARRVRQCECDRCEEQWFTLGWICPDA